MSRTGFTFAFLALLVVLSHAELRAQFTSPGKLSQAHKHLEGDANCARCHDVGRKSFRDNCLQCHGEIQSRIKDGHGYHFFTRKLECSTCHKEHHGREFKLIRWDPANFEHAQTGFVLEGKHADRDCRTCHQPGNIKAQDIRKKSSAVQKKTYLGLSTECSSCHADEHRGQLAACGTCHTPSDWKKHRFDHDKARFALKGKHAALACSACHPEKNDGNVRYGNATYTQFKGIAFAQCLDCHEDHHRGAFGKDCKSCHSPSGWKYVVLAKGAIDHSSTRFPLLGRHNEVSCSKCHDSGSAARFKNADLSHCVLCHADYHAGEFAQRKEGGDCEHCHDVAGFTPARFEPALHEASRFPLRGAHAAVPCFRCHVYQTPEGGRRHRFRWEERDCQACHDNPHRGQLDQRIADRGCAGCHNTDSWFVTSFDHDVTAFPLSGAHRHLLCERCHTRELRDGQSIVRFRFTSTRCAECHTDAHDGQFAEAGAGTDCARCHSTAAWKPVNFNHTTGSRFPLTGKHMDLPCEKCHRPIVEAGNARVLRYKPLDTACSSCHTTERQ